MSMKEHIARLQQVQPAGQTAAVTPSTEDLDPGAVTAGPPAAATVTITPNPDNLRALHETYDRLEQEADKNVQEELQDTQDGLTEVRDTIDGDNANGGLSAESACFAAMAIESYSTRLGIRSAALTSSLESAIAEAANGKVVISTEALTESLEGVDNVGKSILKRAASTAVRAYSPIWVALKVVGLTLGSTIEKAGRIKASPGATIKIDAGWVKVGPKVSTNLAEDFQRSVEVLDYLIGSFGNEAKQAFQANLKAVKALDAIDSPEQLPSALSHIVAHWRDPRSKIGPDAAKPLIGNSVVFEDQSPKYHGDNPDAKKLDALANQAYPTVAVGSYRRRQGGDDKGKVEIPALTPDQIARIGSMLTQAIKKFGFWKAAVETYAASFSMPQAFDVPSNIVKLYRRTRGSAAISGRHDKLGAAEMNALKDALKTSNRMILHVPYDAGVALLRLCSAYKKVAKLSLKAHAQASLEAFGNNNAIDGVTVNETAAVEPSQEPAKDATAPEGEVKPKQDGIQDLAVMHQNVNGPTEPAKAEAELAQIAKDQEIDVPAPQQSGGPGLESHQLADPGVARPYWFKG